MVSERKLIKMVRDLFAVYKEYKGWFDKVWSEFEKLCSAFGIDPETAMECSLWLEEKNKGLYIRIRTPTKTLSKYVRKEKRDLAEKLLALKNELREMYRNTKYIESELINLAHHMKALIEFIEAEMG